jgi:hypothetical protein
MEDREGGRKEREGETKIREKNALTDGFGVDHFSNE